jgi:hypothetical protein
MKTDGKDEGNLSCAKREIREQIFKKFGYYKLEKSVKSSWW